MNKDAAPSAAPSRAGAARRKRRSPVGPALLCVLAVLAGGRGLFSSQAVAETQEPGGSMKNPSVVIETSEGAIRLELFADKAPKSVENFLQYVDDEFYNGTVFHRVIDGFMIQGGGFTAEMQKKTTRPPIRNEARSDVKNLRGTVAMARTNDLHSATSQFFINVADNAFLDHKDETSRGFGYAVFGKVTEGMEVVDKIKSVRTTAVGGFADVPATPVVIHSIRRVQAEEP